MPLNKPLVERKVTLILADLPQVTALAALPVDAYLADVHNEVLAERYLERIIGRVIDINYHLITESTGTTPKSYAESFLHLAPLGVLDPTTATGLAPPTSTTGSTSASSMRRWRRSPPSCPRTCGR